MNSRFGGLAHAAFAAALLGVSVAGAAGQDAATPLRMDVDVHAVDGGNSDANGVLEPGETVLVSPFWKNDLSVALTFTATASGLTGLPGPSYSLTDGAANYGTVNASEARDCASATGDCYLMTVAGTRPAAHWDARFTEELSTNSITHLWRLHVGDSFADVPRSHPFYTFIENAFHNGLTGGCGADNFCPASPVSRAQMAVLLLKGKYGANHLPPPATGTVFHDVRIGDFAADWIEELAGLGITGGCGAGRYCPKDSVTRAQMAAFLLKTEHGSDFAPPACAGVFADVACPGLFADWIERLSGEGITAGCDVSRYCPDLPNTRAQIAVFLVRTFGLQLYAAAPFPQDVTVALTARPAFCPSHLFILNEFSPSPLHVRAGDTVSWIWSGGVHSTTSGNPGAPDGTWDSGTQSGPFTFSQTFSQTGTFPYYCAVGHDAWRERPCGNRACCDPYTAYEQGTVIVDP